MSGRVLAGLQPERGKLIENRQKFNITANPLPQWVGIGGDSCVVLFLARIPADGGLAADGGVVSDSRESEVCPVHRFSSRAVLVGLLPRPGTGHVKPDQASGGASENDSALATIIGTPKLG